ncbi:hypothetical protein G3M48_002786, partial [Beauveria asiatica]
MPESGDCCWSCRQARSGLPASQPACQLRASGRRQNSSSGQGGGASSSHPINLSTTSRQAILRRQGPQIPPVSHAPAADTPIRSIMAQVPVQTLYRDPQL